MPSRVQEAGSEPVAPTPPRRRGRPPRDGGVDERRTIRLSPKEWARVARYARSVAGVTEHGWLRQRVLEAGRVAFLPVRLARLLRTTRRCLDALPASARPAMQPVLDEIEALYAEAAGE